MLLAGLTGWLILAALAAAIVIGGNRKPTPHPDPLREDDEVAALDALWELPARGPSRWWPPC